MMELTFNLTEDRREPLKPQSLKDFELTFGNGSGVNVQSNNWVQGRLQMDNLRQVFVNIQQGEDNEPYDITGYILQFCGRTPFDGKQQSYRVIDNSSVVVDGLHGRFRYTFPAQAFAVAGTYKQAYFRLIRLSDYKCIATLEFDLSVLEDFVFADMVPSDYINPFNDILNQLLDGEKKFKADTQTLYEEAAKRLNDAVTQLTQLGTDVKTTLATEQAALQQLIEKIKENNPFTQAEADAFKQEVVQKLQQQQSDFLNKINEDFNSSSQEALYASQTNWIAELPSYMASNWAGVVNNVPHGDHIFNFGLLSDNHFQLDNSYSYRSLDHYVWFGEATRKAGVDAVVINGDNINGDNYSLTYAEANKRQLVKSTLTVVDVLEGSIASSTPCFWIKGNHDTGVMNEVGITGPNSTLSEEDLKHYYHTTDCRYGEVRDGNSLYFYKDFPDRKIRLIGLNTIDDTDDVNADGSWKTKGIDKHKIRQSQLEWLVNTALKVDDPDYQVIFCFHTPLNNTIGSEAELQNSDALLNIIKAYKAGSATTINTSGDYAINSLNVDFTKQGPRTVVGIFNGHLHYDANNTTALDGTPIIEQTCSTIQAHGKARDKNTVDEDAWDIVSIDTAKRQIHMYRFGAGDDQSFSY